MTTYSPPVVLYLILQTISIVLLSILIIAILRSQPYFTKWTLFQLCISAWFVHIGNVPAALIYGDQLRDRVFETSLCIVQHEIGSFFFYQIQYFPAVLSFYLWYALVRNNIEIEKLCFWYASGIIWVASSVYMAIRWAVVRKEPNWGVEANRLYCTSTNTGWLAFIIPTTIVIFIALFFVCHSSVLLFWEWRRFVQKQNRRTAIRRGQAVRLMTCSVFYITLLSSSLIPKLVKRANNIDDLNVLTPSEYTGSVIGIVLFLIFGTRKSATVFLPCCYYAPPEAAKIVQNAGSFANPNTIRKGLNETHPTDFILTKKDNDQEMKFVTITSEAAMMDDVSDVAGSSVDVDSHFIMLTSVNEEEYQVVDIL